MTTKQATEWLKKETGKTVSVRRIQAMIKHGQLEATKEGRDWDITEKALEKVKDRKPGRPRKPKTPDSP